MSNLTMVILAVVVVVAVMSAPVASVNDEDYPDEEIPDCVDELDPCGPYANSTFTKPSDECCKPLKNALETDLGCVCSIFASPNVVRSLELNVTAALTLPKRCGVDLDLVKQCEALAKVPATAPIPAESEKATGDAPRRIVSFGLVLLLLPTLMFN